MYHLSFPVMCYCLGLQKRGELCYQLRVDGDHLGLQYLKSANDIFVKWKVSDTAVHTNETFTACIRTMNVLLELAKHLQKKHRFLYVISGKFMSDFIDGRFEWYRQVNGGNFYMLVKQML